MSANDITEWLLIGLFILLFLLHPAVMGMVLKKNGGFRNGRLWVYTVISIFPLMVSASFLIFGPDDLSGRLDLADYQLVAIAYLVVNLLVCAVLLFTMLSSLTINTRIMMLLSTIVSAAMSLVAFIAATFATV